MLTDAEARELTALKKRFVDNKPIAFPAGSNQTFELLGEGDREKFQFDVSRGSLRLSKLKHQTRARQIFVLVRVDIDGAPHTNPDGKKMGRTHMHLYREGYDDKWAYPLDSAQFRDTSSIPQVFADFCRYCNISEVPELQGQLL